MTEAFKQPAELASPESPLTVMDDGPQETYLNNDFSWKSWIYTLDHKRIAMMYLVMVSVFFIVGSLAAGMVRYNLLEPPGLLGTDTYNRAFTAHGIIMVFFFLIPAIPAVLGNFFIPPDAGRARCRVSQAQYALVLFLYRGSIGGRDCDVVGRR